MLKTYLFALIIGIQAFFGVSYSAEVADRPKMFESGPVLSEVSPQLEQVPVYTVDEDYLDRIKSMGITLHPGSEFAPDDNADDRALNECASLVYDVFQVMPPEVIEKVKNLTLYFNSHGRRGLGGGSTIILRCQNLTDKELASVLVHELGHIEDTAVLIGSKTDSSSEFMDGNNQVLIDDPSLDFYRLSFANDALLKSSSIKRDFVSIYAMTDPFEDFAETFNFYLLHGELFREMKNESKILQHKYTFMKEKVFGGQEFFYESDPLPPLKDYRIYDSTTLGYNLSNFLANK